MKKLAHAITNTIHTNNPNLTDLQVKTIQFGMECFLSEFSKFCMYLIIFYLFSSISYLLTAMFFFCMFRVFSGGYHEETYWRCFFTTLLIFISIILVGIQTNLPLWFGICGWIIAGIFTVIYAPVDHPNKPIISPKRRSRFKILSIIILIIFTLGSLFLPEVYRNIALAALIIQALTLPIGYKKNKNFVRNII